AVAQAPARVAPGGEAARLPAGQSAAELKPFDVAQAAAPAQVAPAAREPPLAATSALAPMLQPALEPSERVEARTMPATAAAAARRPDPGGCAGRIQGRLLTAAQIAQPLLQRDVRFLDDFAPQLGLFGKEFGSLRARRGGRLHLYSAHLVDDVRTTENLDH